MTTTVSTAPTTHPVVSELEAAGDSVGSVRETPLFGLSDGDLVDAVELCEQLRARVWDVELALVAEADGRDLGRREGAASTAAFLGDRFRMRPGDARRLVSVANRTRAGEGPIDYAANVRGPLTGRELPATGAALADGVISPEHVAVVANVMRRLPESVSVEQAQAVEHDLVGFCGEFDPGVVTRLGDYLLQVISGDETLDEQEAERHRKRDLRFNEETGRVTGMLTREAMALVRTALDPLAAPTPTPDGERDSRSAGQRLADALEELSRRAIAADGFEANHGMSHRVLLTLGLDALAAAHQCTENCHDGDQHDPATGENVESGENGAATVRENNPATGSDSASAAGPAPERSGGPNGGPTGGQAGAAAGDPATVSGPAPANGTAPERAGGPPFEDGSAQSRASAGCELGSAAEAARRAGVGVAPGELAWGGAISAAAARRIACFAGIQRIVLDPMGAVLDVGREYRTATPTQFAALIARDRGCAFPGCTRPASWCIAHHIIHWVDGGPTNLDNLVLLCTFHHTVVHHRGWDVQLAADRLPTFYPPTWIHPDRQPRRNNRPRYGQTTVVPDR